MFWIHGGGYTLGSKVLYSPSAAGLLHESQNNAGDGVIWVGINYRLGAYVCLSPFVLFVSNPQDQLTPVSRASFRGPHSKKKVAPQMQACLTSVLL